MDKYKIELPVIHRNLSNDGIFEIVPASPADTRKALEEIARYFLREFHYDGIQYEADEHLFEYIEYKGFVFLESSYDTMTDKDDETHSRILGGACFRNREYENGPQWVLDWVWLHPFARNQGILKKHWSKFKSIFGNDFHVEPPLSLVMENFIEKYHKISQS